VGASTNLHASLAVRPPVRAGSPQRILIVDDDLATTKLLKTLLAAWRWKTRVARSASKAIAVAVEFQPTIILLDLELPDMSGYEVARLLRQHPQLQDVRLIALTLNGEHDSRELAREAGFERYLMKPVTGPALEELFALP
jgi:CheY-like chemotaxis protein